MTTFNASSTADEVLAGQDLTGIRVLITGTSAGIGVEVARTLAAHGADIIGTARDLAKAREATKEIIQPKRLELLELDLASLASVQACANALTADAQPFDVVIANAGVMACPFARTSDGFELQLATNYLGHFLLVNRLAHLIRPGGRLVTVSSVAHRLASVNLDDPNFQNRTYGEFEAYGQAKTACALFAVAFDARHRSRGVRATTLNPGAIYETDLARHMNPQVIAQAVALGAGAVQPKSISQGAATTVWAGFVAPADEVAARYCEDCAVAPVSEATTPFAGVRSYAIDPELARAWWTKTEALLGEVF